MEKGHARLSFCWRVVTQFFISFGGENTSQQFVIPNLDLTLSLWNVSPQFNIKDQL